MLAYTFRRILLIIPTLLGIMIVNFLVVQLAPGGPVEQLLAEMSGQAVEATARIAGESGDIQGGGTDAGVGTTESKYRGAQGLDPAIIEEIERDFGFDKPLHERFFTMMWNYMRFDFGTSYFRDEAVIDLVLVQWLP